MRTQIGNIQSDARRSSLAMPRKSGSRLSNASGWAAFLLAYSIVAYLILVPFLSSGGRTPDDGRTASLTVTESDRNVKP